MGRQGIVYEYTHTGIRIAKGNHFAYTISKYSNVGAVPPNFACIRAARHHRQPHNTFHGKGKQVKDLCCPAAVRGARLEQGPEEFFDGSIVTGKPGRPGTRGEPSQKTCL